MSAGGQIKYRKGYKYQLAETYSLQTNIIPPNGEAVSNRFVRLDIDGTMTLREDYAWDGPSGPTEDTPDSMRGSLPHDGGYQLIREGLLDETIYKPQFDKLAYSIWIEDKMAPHRAKVWYEAVRILGAKHADPKNDKQVFTAP